MGKTTGRTKKSSRRADTGLRGASDCKGGDVLRRAQGPPRRNGIGGAGQTEQESQVGIESLIKQVEIKLQEGQIEAALPIAKKALSQAQSATVASTAKYVLQMLNMLAEIHLELGEPDEARRYFLSAVDADPDGTIAFADGAGNGGVEKFLYLSQLSEEGGEDSIRWLQRGADILRREIDIRRDTLFKFERMRLDGKEPEDAMLQELQGSLARALCAEIEIYMTDLSFSSESEGYCEKLIAEALPSAAAACNRDPTALQTLANIRISQCRMHEAQRALKDSLLLWDNSLPDDGLTNKVPDFPTRISLSRLLMEAEMEMQALEVLERLVSEDDQSIEAWYLGGWCLYLLAQKWDAEDAPQTDPFAAQKASRQWLRQGLSLYETLQYEDERLRDHAMDLVKELDGMLPDDGDETDEGSEGGEWESDDSEDDEGDEGSGDEDME